MFDFEVEFFSVDLIQDIVVTQGQGTEAEFHSHTFDETCSFGGGNWCSHRSVMSPASRMHDVFHH